VRIAVDTGGTFTDFVVVDGGSVRRFKLPSTPADPAIATIRGCAEFDAGFDLCHGTTVATNAILEGKTARTGLVVNAGFRDLLSLGRQSRPELYDWEPRKPRLPVRDEDVRTVVGRTGMDGTEIEPFVFEELCFDGCEAVAICLLYSYADAFAEETIARGLSGVFVSASHEVSPEMREYERACATVLNAAVGPVITKYFGRLQESGADRIRIMSSMGGLISLEDAARLPIRTVVSGPAGGVVATVALGKRLNRPNTIAFDMGGTSTDVTLIHEGEPSMTACADIAGLPVRLRRIDVHTVGCGGGSIAYLDEAGALRVGPESAGAEPGPALYGGERPTVTDANFVLGRLPLSRFAKTEGLDPSNCAVVMNGLASDLRLSLEEAAEAVVAVADAQMAAAVRKVSADRGFPPADFSLVAFGGAGGLHACAVAELLDIEEILCPVGAGVFSALGLLGAPDAWEESLGVLGTSNEWEQTYTELESVARRHIPDGADIRTMRIADMRYQGQSHDLAVHVSGSRKETAAAFHELHREIFGTHFEGRTAQWVTARVRAESTSDQWVELTSEAGTGAAVDGIIDREALVSETAPKVIADDDCTVYLASGWLATRLSDGTVRLARDTKGIVVQPGVSPQ
jgi:N-methylhydantoinase A